MARPRPVPSWSSPFSDCVNFSNRRETKSGATPRPAVVDANLDGSVDRLGPDLDRLGPVAQGVRQVVDEDLLDVPRIGMDDEVLGTGHADVGAEAAAEPLGERPQLHRLRPDADLPGVDA